MNHHAFQKMSKAKLLCSTHCWLLCVISSILVISCGEQVTEQYEPPEPGPIAERPTLVANSTSGCSLDADCAPGLYCFQNYCAAECNEQSACSVAGQTCTDRGRCQNPPLPNALSVASREDIRTDLKVVSISDTIMVVSKDQNHVKFTLTLDKPAPAEGLLYRVDRNDSAHNPSQILRAVGGNKTVEFSLPVGQAAANATEQKAVNLKLFTSVGNYNLAILPQAGLAGDYAGTLTIKTFGNTGLPLSFQIVTQPDNSSLREAEKAWLLLPVGSQHLFSPLRTDDPEIKYVARELSYDDFVDRWVAGFDMAFDLTQNSVVSASQASQTRRSMRIELEASTDNKYISGVMTDRWAGLYEERSSDGISARKDITFTGKLNAERVGPAPSFKDVVVRSHPLAAPEPLGFPSLNACSNDQLLVPHSTLDEHNLNCAGLTTLEAFKNATPQAQATCALAISNDALKKETVGKQISAFLDDGQSNPEGQSFAEFMEDCARGSNESGSKTVCRPSQQVLCGRQLLAYAHHDQPKDSPLLNPLISQYNEISREAYLGQQLGAFSTDSKLRLEWLQNSEYPAVVLHAVQTLNIRLLDDWTQKVLNVHLNVLKSQLDNSGISIFSRHNTNAEISESREQILSEMLQSWRGTLDTLTMATKRWDTLYKKDADRNEKQLYASSRMLDLYLSAGLLHEFNNVANLPELSGELAGGFSELLRSVNTLSLSFDKLLYSRDAEVVVSTSLNPNSTNRNLLSERKLEADKEIERTHNLVRSISQSTQAEALSSEQLRNRLNNQINDLRDDLAELCGLPAGCTASTFRTDPTCYVRVEAGQCGFLIDKDSNELLAFTQGTESVSEAGRLLLKFSEAAQNVSIASEDAFALSQRNELEYEELTVFKETIESWNELRMEQVDQLQENLQKRQNIRNEKVSFILENLEERAHMRKEGIKDATITFAKWDKIRTDNVQTELGYLTSINRRRRDAETVRSTAEMVKDLAEATAEAIPDNWSDFGAQVKAAILLSSAGTAAGMRTSAIALDHDANSLEIKLEAHKMLQEAQMTRLQEQEEIGDLIDADELETLKEAVQSKELLSDAEIEFLKEVIELSQAQSAAQMAYQRDMDDFRQRRLSLFQNLTQATGLDLRIEQANIQLQQAIAQYLAIIQRAELRNAKLQNLLLQRNNVNRLVGSPAVLFGRANQVEQAEQRLERSKEKLMNWLVALEFYAVRPFIEQRMQILLARNTYQLEQIAEELKTLENNCGGPINQHSAVLSMRKDLMGLLHASTDPVTQKTLSPTERFQEILGFGFVPIDKRVRYSSDKNVGALLQHNPNILAGTFFIDLSDFSNLELTCNAKIASIALNLVGDIGTGRPTVSVLYDGTSKLRSCQPGLEAYIDLHDANLTSFGTITQLRAQGRSMSPVAGVNQFLNLNGQDNHTLSGLPLASQYTVLINKEAGENSTFDWSKLEDIELKITYDYQDIFPHGQCG